LQKRRPLGDNPANASEPRKVCPMNIDAIAIGKNPPEDLNVIIEVPLGGEPIKYEIDKASGALFVDRFLYTPMRYPGNYGFIPHTLCGDGDPLDVLVMNSRPLVPGCVVRCRPFGILFMEDDGGQDEKILAVPVHKLTAMYDKINDIDDMQAIQVERVKHFFTHYKDLEPGKWAKISHVGNAAEARRVILESIERARSAPPAAPSAD
jgi:inorganic pyrophosphatase